MNTEVFKVEGMSCEHCVNAITGEVNKLSGIEQVIVDLKANTVTITADPVDRSAVEAAIDEAGYTVVG
jgi:copper chaperone